MPSRFEHVQRIQMLAALQAANEPRADDWLKGFSMADDKSKVGGQDRARINVNEDYEVRDWCKSLGVTEDELRKAVAAVGDRADKVREHLGKK